MAGIAFGQPQHRPLLVKAALLVLDGQTLPGRASTVGKFHIAGVDQGELILVHHRRTRVAAMAFIGLGRYQRHRLMAPVTEIERAPVAPELGAMSTGKGIPLIEEVITPLMLDKTVGVVKQPHGGGQMPERPVGIGRTTGLPGQQ